MVVAIGITLQSPDVILQIKETVLLVLHVISDEIFDFDVTYTKDVLWELFEIFDALLVQVNQRLEITARSRGAWLDIIDSLLDDPVTTVNLLSFSLLL